MSLNRLNSLFTTLGTEIEKFNNTKTFQISKADHKNIQNNTNSNKKKVVLDKPCQACTYLEALTGTTLNDEPHHAKDCKNFSSNLVNKIWIYEPTEEIKTTHPEIPGKFNLRDISNNQAYKAKYASKPKLTPAQQPKTKQKQQK